MEELNEDRLSEIIIDLNNQNKLNESWLGMFGWWVKAILNRMFGGPNLPITIKGTKTQVSSFVNVLSKEKKYMESFTKHGLDNPQTYKWRHNLNSAISKFERDTGIKWPFN
jgi:hypothetical protein